MLMLVHELDGQCVGTPGQISWHYWENINYYEIDFLYVDDTYPQGPDAIRVLNSLSTPMNYNDHYGSITKGFVSVPETSNVTFNLTGDNVAYMLLSTDETAGNLDTIMTLSEAVGQNEHTRFASQTSSVINMVAGQNYYFELYLVEFNGGDQASVFWQRPFVSDTTWQLITSPFLTDICDPLCPPKGTPCDDGDSLTSDDMEDGSCNCVGSAAPQGFTVGSRGLLQAYFYDDVVGGNVTTLLNDPDFPTMPDRMVHQTTGLEAQWEDDLDDYGTLIEGYLTVPVDGCYDFNITGVNEVRFILSTNHDAANVSDSIGTIWGTDRLVHDHPDFNGMQTMNGICLEANKYYYFKLLQVVPSWGSYVNVFWKGPQHVDDQWHHIPELFLYDYEDELACLPQGALCNDGDPLTANDQIDANCNCVGTPCDPLVNCDDPSVNYAPYDYCQTTDELDVRDDDVWLSCAPLDNPYVSERSGRHWIHYDLGSAYLLGQTHVWNYNVAGATNQGFQQVAVDYSLDGFTWFHLDDFVWPLAPGSSGYTGFDGPDFQNIQMRYVMFTSLDDPSSCRGISKITFEASLCPERGTACDDGRSDTFNDHIQEDCECIGYTIEELDCGLDTLFINQTEMSPSTYHAISALMSRGNVLNGGDANYKAGMQIVLEAGFEVSDGGLLEASVEDCPTSLWSKPSGKKVYAIIDESGSTKLIQTKREPNSLEVYGLKGHTDQTIHFNLEKASRVRIELIDQSGELIHVVTEHRYDNFGDHYKRLQTRRLSPGIYMIKMIINGDQQYVDKMIVH